MTLNNENVCHLYIRMQNSGNISYYFIICLHLIETILKKHVTVHVN